MILSVGEILVDMIGEEKDGTFSYQRKAGGAPFNVACAIKKYHGNSGFVGSVGEDIIGKFLIKFAKEQNLDYLNIKLDQEHNTTLAFVDIDQNGERNFCFYRKNTSDYFLPYVDEELIKNSNIIHIGSLMISELVGFNYALELISRVHKLNKLISFDINFRTDIFQDKDEAIKRYQTILKQSDIIKLSEDELEIFPLSFFKENVKDALLCISLGGKGSRCIYKNIDITIPSIKVNPIDTTGAGDSFYAGVLSLLDKHSQEEWNKENLISIFKFANVAGALNTLGKGAIDSLPSYEQVISKVKEIK